MITAMPRIAIASAKFEEMVATMRSQFGMPVIDLSGESVASLGAKLAMCVPPGGSHIELMSPADSHAPLSRSLYRFLERRGAGLFALMLEAPDPDAEARVLAARGLEVLPLMPGAAGRDLHPRSTCGVLIRIYPERSFTTPADALGASGHGWRLSGIRRVIVAVRDLEHARMIYREKLGLPLGATCSDTVRGVTSAIAIPPAGGTIELVAVADATRPFAATITDQLVHRGEGMHALVLDCDDERHARELTRFGTRFLFEANPNMKT